MTFQLLFFFFFSGTFSPYENVGLTAVKSHPDAGEDAELTAYRLRLRPREE